MRLYGTNGSGTIQARTAVLAPPTRAQTSLAPLPAPRRAGGGDIAFRELAVRDRPREKLVRHGPGSLGDNELLAIVLGHGSRGLGVLTLANQLLSEVGGLHGLARSPRDLLRRWAGVGPAQAARILAAVELGRRSILHEANRPQLGTPQQAAAFLAPEYGGRAVEHFGIVLLDTRYRVLRTALLTVGVLDTAPTHPREVFREAVAGGAAAIVMFHNHPSGDPSPSVDDVDLTVRMVASGDVMGIAVLDHVILANNRYFSFKESRPRVLGDSG
jgi:DNA repair protein RadC